MREWLERERPAAIVHLAGIVDVRYCTEHPLEAFRVHVSDTASILEAVRLGAPETPVVYVASDKSFGEQEGCGLDARYEASFPYETSKACEDMLVESYAATYSLPFSLVRFPNFFGEADRHVERLIPGSASRSPRAASSSSDSPRRDGPAVRLRPGRGRDRDDDARRGAGRRQRLAEEPLRTAAPEDRRRRDPGPRGGHREDARPEGAGPARRGVAPEHQGRERLGFEYTDWLPALERTAAWYLDAVASGGL